MSEMALQDTDLPTETPAATPTLAPDGGDTPTSEASGHSLDVSRDTSGDRWVRDESGRFAPKPKVEGTAAPAEGSAAAATATDGGAAEEQQEIDPAEEGAAPEGLAALEQQGSTEEEGEPEGQPWSFRSEGRDYTLGNSTFYPGIGLVVPEAHVDTLHKLLGRVVKSDAVLAQREQMFEEARQQIAAEKEFNASAAQQWRSLAQLVQEGRHEEAFKTLLDFAVELPQLELQSQLKVKDEMLESLKRQNQPDPAIQQRQALEEADEALGGLYETLVQQPWAQVLTEQDKQRVANAFARRQREYVVRGPDGALYLDEARAQQEMQDELQYLAGLRREQAEAARRVQQAAEQNARRTKETIAASPPAVTGTPAVSTPPARAKKQQFASAEDYYNWTSSTD